MASSDGLQRCAENTESHRPCFGNPKNKSARKWASSHGFLADQTSSKAEFRISIQQLADSSRTTYSVGVVYNPFPWPDLGVAKDKLAKLGQAILDARAGHPKSTLADLYDPLTMPADLRKAHEANDKAVDQLYRKEPFNSDRERVEFLLARYEQITAPALALAARNPKRKPKG